MYRDFTVVITNANGEEIGSMMVPSMFKDSRFVDIITAAYYGSHGYQTKPTRVKESEDFTVDVYKIDTAGRKRLVNSMDVNLPGDSNFEEVLELCYHGCTDND